MTKPRVTPWSQYRWAAAMLISSALAAPAFACQNPNFRGPAGSSAPAPRAAPAAADIDGVLLPALYSPADKDGFGSVVGMWHAIFRIGDASGPVFDEVLEQFHSDGTELIISSGLPPALGNVCIGVWKRVGAHTYKLKHMTWNWSPPDNGFGVPGTFAGHFELDVTLRVDARGDTFTGRWTAQNFGLDGEHLPGLDAEGIVKGVRIGVD
jgi:hypothetical protein